MPWLRRSGEAARPAARRDGGVGRHERVGGEIGQRRRGADAETVAVGLDAGEARVLEVDEQ